MEGKEHTGRSDRPVILAVCHMMFVCSVPKGCLPLSLVIIMTSVVCLNIVQVVSAIVCGYLNDE